MTPRHLASPIDQRMLPTVATVNLALFLFFSLTTIYRGSSIIDEFFFRVNDPPWMPTDRFPEPIIGSHHFGDLKIWLGYAEVPNPYGESVQYAPASPMLAVIFFRFLLLAGEPLGGQLLGSLILFTLIQGSAAALTVVRISRHFCLAGNLLPSTVVILTSPGFLMALDRGGSHILAGSLAINYLLSAERSSARFSIVWIIFAVALKPYFIVCLLYKLARGQVRNSAADFAIICTANLIPFLLIDNSFGAFTRWFDAMIGHEFGGRSLLKSISFFAAYERVGLTGVLESLTGLQPHLTARIIALTFTVFTVMVVRYDPHPEFRVLAVMSCSTFLIPLSYWYTTAWIPLTIALILSVISKVTNRCSSVGVVHQIGYSLFCFGLAGQLLFLPFYNGQSSGIHVANPVGPIMMSIGAILISCSISKGLLGGADGGSNQAEVEGQETAPQN